MGLPDRHWEARLVAVMWAGYLFALPFHRVWSLPWLGTKLQPPEIVLLGLVAVAVVLWWRRRVRWRLVLCDAAPAAWLIANVVALVTVDGHLRFTDIRTITESLGAVSLVCLYAAIRLTATPRLLDRFGEWFANSAAIAAAWGIAGVVLAWFGQPTSLATDALTPVPYLQHAPRAQAFTAGPQMLASVLLLAVPLFIGARTKDVWRRRDTAVLLLLVGGLIATVSKTALCLAVALAVMWASGRSETAGRAGVHHKRRVWLATGLSFVVVVIFAVGSHLMLVRTAEIGTWQYGQVVAGRPLASFDRRGEPWLLMPTTYFLNKQASLLAIGASWPVGVGPARQPVFTAQLQREGRFPASIWITQPHSTYLGPVAELGAPGLLALSLLLLTGGAAIRRLLGSTHLHGWEAAAYAGAGAAFLIEAISTDLLNCRHYWWLFAIVAARLAEQALQSTKPAPA